MKIAILGFARQGQSAYKYWLAKYNDITICDLDESIEVPKGVKTKLGKNYLTNLNEYDLIVRSPIIHPRQIVSANGPDILKKVSTPTNEFFRVCPTKNIIGVTGTKGKGTTSALITKILEANNKRVHLGGNFGTSPLDLLDQDIKSDDWVVLELANFQLIDLKHSPHIAICLMIAPEHLDWHKDMDEYVNAKAQLFRYQKKDDIAIFYPNSDLSRKVVQSSHGHHIPYMTEPGAIVKSGQFYINDQAICKISDIKLLGKHNWQNICAAITVVWQINQDPLPISKTLSSFAGLEHRLELVRELGGVKYYNDSFASAPDATVAAIDAIAGQKILVVGGFDRQLDLKGMITAITEHSDQLVKVLLIGASAKRIEKELKTAGFTNYEHLSSKSVGDIVARAQELAKAGQSVVLSPGFPSFDMFKNFEERGELYKEAVNQL